MVFLEILTSGRKIERVSTAATDKIQGQQEVPPYHTKSPLKEKSPLNFQNYFSVPLNYGPKKIFSPLS